MVQTTVLVILEDVDDGNTAAEALVAAAIIVADISVFKAITVVLVRELMVVGKKVPAANSNDMLSVFLSSGG
jgi:hypothetical protein